MRLFILLFLLIAPAGQSMAAELACTQILQKVSNPELSKARIEAFKKQWSGVSAQIDNPAKNKVFINLVMQIQEESALYFQVENGVLKELNDRVIIDKELVTTLDSYLKKRLIDKIQHSPRLKDNILAQYTDYKSLHMAFKSDSKAIRAELEAIFQQSMQDLQEQVESLEFGPKYRNLKGLVQSPLHWYLAGFGDSNDKANFAARLARGLSMNSTKISPVDFEEYRHTFIELLDQLRELRKQFHFEHSSAIMEKVEGASVFSLDFVEIFRKAKADNLEQYIQYIQERTRERFGINLQKDTVVAMKKYYETMDLFSPSLLIEKRIQIDMSKSTSGNFSIDLVGMGARNFQRLMAATINGENSTVEEMLKNIRRSEIMATEDLLDLRNKVKNSIHSVESIRRGTAFDLSETLQYTGDDMVYFPNGGELQDRHKIAMLQNLAKNNQLGNFRPVFLAQKNLQGEDIENTERIRLLVEGETLEKYFRLDLEKHFPFKQIKPLIIGIDINVGDHGIPLYRVIIVKGRSSIQANSAFEEIARNTLKNHLQGKLIELQFIQ